MTDTAQTTPGEGGGVSRRAVMRAGVWSVPVIAAAVAVPARAASAGDVARVEFESNDVIDGAFPYIFLYDANDIGVEGVDVTFTVVSGPVEIDGGSIGTATSFTGGAVAFPGYTTGTGTAVITVQVGSLPTLTWNLTIS
ncbi:hypothetical protein GCM10025768_25850 [Microbacterium pseudoresistens]|uniref:Uncharacterized protein n=1 Tax=Microbacterium pseudoresistens TaxID=640634 RepID=A0A7Y9EY39_9MICO|nr:hypothetical protein [Microbacterium pseudoresistens]NYD55205.1 hypothetical protein [Microbacterium pseudoresistens]